MRPFYAAIILLALPPAFAADPQPKPEPPSFQVPYRLTDTKHVLVRVKINGKGPFNFILDTGAPALFVATVVGKKLGVEADAKGWSTFDPFEIEGGVVLRKVHGRVDDPYQVEGMNQLGLAGATLHGVIGFNVLARYRLTFDFTKDKMTWTPLDFEPALPKIGPQKGGVDALGGLAKVMSALLGKKLERETRFRGFLGVQLVQREGSIEVQAVLPDSPAAQLRIGDLLTAIDGKPITLMADAERLLRKHGPGDMVKLTTRSRDGREDLHKITLGKGF